MFVDISDLAYEVSELLTIQRVEDIVADEYGLQTSSLLPEIVVSCMIIENMSKILDVSTGSYLPKVTYDIYVPYNIANGKNFTGAVVVRGDGSRYVISTQPLKRAYASHVVYGAVEERVVDDRT